MWAFSRDYSLMGRSSKLGDELLNEPFDDVKARMVCFPVVDEKWV